MISGRNKCLAALLLFAFPFLCFAHGSAAIHYDDFTGVFNGYGDSTFQELSKRINSGIDAYSYTIEVKDASGKVIRTVTEKGLPGLFKERLGSLPGNHRVLGHGWALNDAIPRQTLDYLCKTYPGKESEIIDVWRVFAKRITEEAVSTTGLPAKQANAFASLLYDIHLLGDVEPDNKLIELVLSPEDIVRNINKDAQILFQNKPQYSNLIRRRLSLVMRQMKGKNPQVTAQALMDELYRLRMGDMLKDTWGKTLKPQYSVDRVVAANERLAQRTLQRAPGVPERGSAVSRPSVKKSDFYKKSSDGKILHAGLLTSDGRLLLAVKEGGKTALVIFAIEGGVASYKYFHGDILKPEFEEKMIEAAIKGSTVGTAVGVTVLLGATPGGLVVFAVGTGAYVIVDWGISLWREYQAKKYLTIADLESYGIKMDTILDLPPEDIFSMSGNSTLKLRKDTTLELPNDSTLVL